MSNYTHFYNNFCGNNFTFQRPPSMLVPPPPPPPPFFIPPSGLRPHGITDEEFVKQFECKVTTQTCTKPQNKDVTISGVREQLHNLLSVLNDLKSKEKMLEDNISTLSDEQWSSAMDNINESKLVINQTLSCFNGSYLDVLRKLLSKRTAKRLRLKSLREEQKKEKEKRIKELQERSRKIDEKLQKIKDEFNKARQEEESKIQADIVLKEVLRKKQDARKCIVKLDALVKLRKARQNTASGRGEHMSENDAVTFNSNIEKLKTLWMQRQAVYEKEEAELRAKLTEDSKEGVVMNETERVVRGNLEQWQNCLFGGTLPQVDFGGDVRRFIGVRSEWDKCISSEGTPLPIGWVMPTEK